MKDNIPLHGPNTRYGAIDATLFSMNRKRLADKLPSGSLVVVHASDSMPMSGDGVRPFVQSSDLFYLSGIDQEETVLVMYKRDDASPCKEMLFIKETTPEIAIWEGQKYTHAQAQKASGMAQVYSLGQLEGALRRLFCACKQVYLNTNEHTRAVVEVESRDRRFISWCQQHYPLHSYQRLAPLMASLRAVKSATEVDLIRRACEITRDGFCEMLPRVKAGMKEYALEAMLMESFIRQGSDGFAYEPIIASGKNACVLHYTANNQVCQAGDLILLDVGAGYANYKSDMTRVVPVDGRFTKRQKEVYHAVLDTMKQAKTLLKPGSNLMDYHKQVGHIMEEKLVGLGLLTMEEIKHQNPAKPAYKRYFMHGTSHHLGLDTHDLAQMDNPFEVGMVFTVEPGIYIPAEGIGIRLENDVVIRQKGVEDLMSDIPLEIEEIEACMHAKTKVTT